MGKHTLDGSLDDSLGLTLSESRQFFGFETTGMTGVTIVDFVLLFGATDLYLLCVDNHDEITAVDMGGEFGFVLATQKVGDFYCQAPKGFALGIYFEPFSGYFVWFGAVGFHGIAPAVYFVYEFCSNKQYFAGYCTEFKVNPRGGAVGPFSSRSPLSRASLILSGTRFPSPI